MEKICLDFETALHFLRGDPATLEKMKYYADSEEICVTSFTLFHLTEAIKKPDAVNAFANNVTVLPFDRRAAHIAAVINRDKAEDGTWQGMTETVMTAAICMANDALLFSKSPSKFDGIKGLKKV